jgi:integrase
MGNEIKVTVISCTGRKFRLRYLDPMTGRFRYKTAGTVDAKEAQKAAGKWQAELREGRSTADSRLSWDAFRERYESEALPRLAHRTAELRHAVMGHIERILSPRRVADLTADRLSFFQAELRKPDAAAVARAEAAVIEARRTIEAARTRPRNDQIKRDPIKAAERRLAAAVETLDRVRRPRADATIKSNLAHLRSILAWAVEIGALREIPRIKAPTRNVGSRVMRGRPVTGEEFDRMLAKVPDVRPADADRWRHYLHGLWLSGLRLEESLRLSWDRDADFRVDLSGRYPRFKIFAEAEKGHRDRSLPLTPDFAAWLLETAESERHGLVFPLGDAPGTQRSSGRVGRVVSEIGERAGVIVNKDQGKFASAHDLRRSFGTRWASKVKPATLQLLMRHATINTTLAYYVDQDADDVARELWASFAAPQTGSKQGAK